MSDQIKPVFGDMDISTHDAILSYVGQYCKEHKITHPEDIRSGSDCR